MSRYIHYHSILTRIGLGVGASDIGDADVGFSVAPVTVGDAVLGVLGIEHKKCLSSV